MAARHLSVLPESSSRVLDTIVIRLSLPALILAVVPDIPIDATIGVPILVAWGTTAGLALAVWGVATLLRFDPVTRATLLVVVPLGNTSFLGFPAIQALLGTEALGVAVIYDQLGSFLALATYAAIMAARFGSPPPGQRVRSPLRRVLTFPPFFALVAAVALRPVGIPDPIEDLAVVLGATVTPLAMLAVGLRLDVAAGRHSPVALASGLVLRMVVAPAAVLGVLAATGAGGLVFDVSLLQSAMPPMVTAAVVASEAGLDRRLAAALAGVGVVAAMVTLPLWALVVG